MADLETRLVEALREAAGGARDASGLAARARTRARNRRRSRMAAGAVVAVLAVAAPVAVVATRGGDDGGQTASDPQQLVPDGFRAESFHGVTLLVPDSWGNGSFGGWCADGREPGRPVVSRPGPVNDIGCTPTSPYGVELGPGSGVEWPLAQQFSDAWPAGAYVAATTLDDVTVTVAVADAADAVQVMGSVRAIGPEGDPNGCPAGRSDSPVDVPDATMTICRYDADGRLEQSERLTGDDVSAAVAALEAAPVDDRRGPYCERPADDSMSTIAMTGPGIFARVTYGSVCPLFNHVLLGDEPRQLTQDVLYWALSPGWSGAVPEGTPLPYRLRQR